VRREIAFLKDEILFSTPYQALVSASGSGAGGGSTLMTQEEAFYIQTILLQHSGFLTNLMSSMASRIFWALSADWIPFCTRSIKKRI